MMATYEFIANVNTTSSQSTLDFTNIPSGYSDLVLKITARSTSTAGQPWLYFQFNNNTQNLSLVNFNTDGTTSVYSGTTVFAINNSANATADAFGSAEFYIMNYSTTRHKLVFASTTQATAGNAGAFYGLTRWADSAIVTSIQINTDGQFAANTNAGLYGIKNI